MLRFLKFLFLEYFYPSSSLFFTCLLNFYALNYSNLGKYLVTVQLNYNFIFHMCTRVATRDISRVKCPSFPWKYYFHTRWDMAFPRDVGFHETWHFHETWQFHETQQFHETCHFHEMQRGIRNLMFTWVHRSVKLLCIVTWLIGDQRHRTQNMFINIIMLRHNAIGMRTKNNYTTLPPLQKWIPI